MWVATDGEALTTPEEAQAQLETYNAARVAGARMPETHEVAHVLNCRQIDDSMPGPPSLNAVHNAVHVAKCCRTERAAGT